MGLLVAILLLLWLSLTLVAAGVRRPHDGSVPTSAMLLRLFGAMLAVAPAGVFLVTLLYHRLRDSLHGAFGSPRSGHRAAGFAALSALVVPVGGAVFYLIGVPDAHEWAMNLTEVAWAMLVPGAAFVAVPLFLIWHAETAGLSEIRQADWVSLDLGR
jgi:hypothetical protein